MDHVELALVVQDLRSVACEKCVSTLRTFLNSHGVISGGERPLQPLDVDRTHALFRGLQPQILQPLKDLVTALAALPLKSNDDLETAKGAVEYTLGYTQGALEHELGSAWVAGGVDRRTQDRLTSEFILRFKEAHPALYDPLEKTIPDRLRRSLRLPPEYCLHEDLAKAAMPLMRSRAYQAAVESGLKSLADLVRAKSGYALDGAELMAKVFSPKSPVLRFNSLVTESERNEQKGLHLVLIGLYTGIRNPTSHMLAWITNEDTAFECLVTLNFFFKKVDSAVIASDDKKDHR